MYWRRGWDSNPRAAYATRRFRGAPVTTTSVPLREVGPLRAEQSVYRDTLARGYTVMVPERRPKNRSQDASASDFEPTPLAPARAAHRRIRARRQLSRGDAPSTRHAVSVSASCARRARPSPRVEDGHALPCGHFIRRVDRECVGAARALVGRHDGAVLQAVGEDTAEEAGRGSTEGLGSR